MKTNESVKNQVRDMVAELIQDALENGDAGEMISILKDSSRPDTTRRLSKRAQATTAIAAGGFNANQP